MEDLDRQILTEFKKLSAEKKLQFILMIPDLLAKFATEQEGNASGPDSVS